MSDANEMGAEAYFRGDDLGVNPYDERDGQHDEWDDGYSQARSSDEKRENEFDNVATDPKHQEKEALKARVEELEFALQDAKLFSEWVEILGRSDCEVYKHELKGSADLSLERIDKALSTTNRGGN